MKWFIKHNIFYYLLCFLVFGCINPAQKSTSAKKAPEEELVPVQSESALISGSPATIAKQDVYYSFTPSKHDSEIQYSFSGIPNWMSVDTSTGMLYGYPTNVGTYDNIVISARKGLKVTTIGPFSILVNGDPLRPDQWHIQNLGQSSYARFPGNSGFDVNMVKTINDGYTGFGIHVAVSDTGLEHDHEDLKNNEYGGHHKNLNLAPPYNGDVFPVDNDGDHGTSVAGIIGAVGWNSIGGRGVAPSVLLGGINYLKSSQSAAVTLEQAQGDYDIFNYSYGATFVPYSLTYSSSLADQVKSGGETLRNNKGAVYVQSSGNSFLECDAYYTNTYLIDQNSGGYACYTHNSNTDPDKNIPNKIIVGAINASGEKSSYSSAGSNLWIAAPGGEFGANYPAIVTTDQSGCIVGYSRSSTAGTNFQTGNDEKNDDCHYTHTFNGTSSAAPMVSGAIALLMEVNPNLTARDIKHILSVSAKKIDTVTGNRNHPSINSLNYDFNLSGHTYEQGWVTNAAGYSFHNYYGFGILDIDAAVALAKTYSSSWGSTSHTNENFSSTSVTVNAAIPDATASGLSSTFYLSSNLSIESIQLKINITHGRPGDIGVELTSPSGTKSILLNINNGFLIPYDVASSPSWVADLTDMVLMSNAFYGENSVGTWTLKVIDGLGGSIGNNLDLASSQSGTLVDWSLNVIGH